LGYCLKWFVALGQLRFCLMFQFDFPCCLALITLHLISILVYQLCLSLFQPFFLAKSRILLHDYPFVTMISLLTWIW
jgi:hypothetical protein